MIKSNEYLSEKFFEKDSSLLFKKHWLFACFTSDIQNKGDYIVKKFSFGEVVIRNFDGEFKAFFNICPHRFSKLFLEFKGSSKSIECPYHGWTFDAKGKALAVPLKKECFGADFRNELYSLHFLDLEVCGKFIFVRAEKDETSSVLKNYLGEKYNYLTEISNYMETKIDENKMSIQANWKLVIENSLDEYHFIKVHKETLASFLSLEYHSEHFLHTSTTEIDLVSANKEKMDKMNVLFEKRYFIENYKHEFIFPNLAIATTNGLSFFIQEAIPVSECETVYISHGFLAPFKEKISDYVRSQLSEQFVQVNRKVFQEDIAICEGIQIALKNPVSFHGLLGSREDRVQHFQELYLKYMNSRDVDA